MEVLQIAQLSSTLPDEAPSTHQRCKGDAAGHEKTPATDVGRSGGMAINR